MGIRSYFFLVVLFFYFIICVPFHVFLLSLQINLGELGFDDFITTLREDYLSHLTRLLYPDWGGDALDSHKAFIVTYKEGMDVDLGYHYDNAEVYYNISL